MQTPPHVAPELEEERMRANSAARDRELMEDRVNGWSSDDRPRTKGCSMHRDILCLLMACLIGACSREPSSSPDATGAAAPDAATPRPEEATWLLEGSTDERFVRVAKHLRGFDVAMVETGYRYGELYWAGRDRNWEYAAYQLAKIETAVANGTERRPKRAASARMLEAVIPQVKDAIARREAAAFEAAFTSLTATCNGCHQAERVPFVRVSPPTVRISPVEGTPPGDGGRQ